VSLRIRTLMLCSVGSIEQSAPFGQVRAAKTARPNRSANGTPTRNNSQIHDRPRRIQGRQRRQGVFRFAYSRLDGWLKVFRNSECPSMHWSQRQAVKMAGQLAAGVRSMKALAGLTGEVWQVCSPVLVPILPTFFAALLAPWGHVVLSPPYHQKRGSGACLELGIQDR
jgi:hypothetical protein